MSNDESMLVQLLAVPELVDHIISCLYYDKPSLKNSSLVCKTWGTFAARYLFAPLTLVYDILYTSNPNCPVFQLRNANLRHCSRITDNVRFLAIAYNGGYPVLPRWDVPLHHLMDDLATFRSVRTLCVDTLCSFTAPSGTIFPHVPSSPILDVFTLNVYSHTFKNLLPGAIFGLFASIKALHLRFHDFSSAISLLGPSGPLPKQPDSSALLSIRSLIVEGFANVHSIPASHFISSSLDCSNVDTFILDDYILETDLVPLNTLIKEHLTGIETFVLSIRRHNNESGFLWRTYPPPHTRMDFDFSPCQRLRSVHIVFWFNCLFSLAIQQRRQGLWGLAVSALSRVLPERLSNIRFRLHLVSNASLRLKGRSTASQSIGALRDLQWSLLETVMDAQPHLQTIEVQLIYDGPRLTASQATLIQAKLPSRLRRAVKFMSYYEADLPSMFD